MYRFMPIPDAKPSHRELNPLTSSQYTETSPSDYPSHQTNKLMTTQSFHIGERPIGIDFPPYLIAELSGNHNKSIERSRKILQHAASSGADAIKLQTYTPDTMTLNVKTDEFYINDKNSPWHGRYLYELYEDAFTPWEWHEELMHEAHRLGLAFFSTPFDETAVDFLETLNVPAYKISSFENTDIPLLRKVAQTGKPLIISCGLINLEELEETVAAVQSAGCNNFALLKCTTSYPASVTDSNLSTISDMRNRFGCEVGLSDHTLGIASALTAIGQGASIIEKHLTLSRADGGVDATFSMEPSEFDSLTTEAKNAWLSLGTVHYGPTASESETIKSRRSIYVAEDLVQGHIVTERDIRRIRPGNGLAPIHYDNLLGKRTTRNIPKGTPASWDLFS